MLIQWEQCLHDFLRSMEVRSVQTSVSYASTLRRFLVEYEPDKVTRREVENFIHSGSHPKVATINKRLSTLSSFYKYASSYVPEGETEPLWKLASPTIGITRGKPERSPKGLSYEELTQFFAVIPQDRLIGIRDKAILILTFWTARRRSEIAGLLYGDIQPALFPGGERGMRQGWSYSFRGKGQKSIRDSQELPQPAKDAIDWYLIASGRMETIQPGDPLFTAIGREEGQGGNVRPGEVRKLSAKGIANRIVLYARMAGLPHVSFHTFRHAAAKARYEAGSDVREIQHLLRHSSLATTDLYLRTLVGKEDKGANLLDEKYRYL